MVPALLAVLVLLILCLSCIFCGWREGQPWRDYKTPKEQLQEYLNVRESQRHLRELSVQRQMLLMNADRSKSATPMGVQTFLQPRGGSVTPSMQQKRAPHYDSQSRLPPPGSPRTATLPRREKSHKCRITITITVIVNYVKSFDVIECQNCHYSCLTTYTYKEICFNPYDLPNRYIVCFPKTTSL